MGLGVGGTKDFCFSEKQKSTFKITQTRPSVLKVAEHKDGVLILYL